jgi:hypothetical protein
VVVIVVVAMTVIVIVVIVIMIATVIAVMVVIPFVIVLDAAVRTFPVTVVEPFSIMARADPAGTLIRRAAPIAFMPTIVSCGGIPVAANPCKFRIGLCGNHGDDAWLGWRTDTDANRYLSASGDTEQRQGRQQNARQQGGPDEISHRVDSSPEADLVVLVTEVELTLR